MATEETAHMMCLHFCMHVGVFMWKLSMLIYVALLEISFP